MLGRGRDGSSSPDSGGSRHSSRSRSSSPHPPSPPLLRLNSDQATSSWDPVEEERDRGSDSVDNQPESRPWSDEFSLGARRLHRLISGQSRYTEDEALNLLLKNVAEENDSSQLSAKELIHKLNLDENFHGKKEKKGKNLDDIIASEKEKREEEEEEAEEEAEAPDGPEVGGTTLAALTRMISMGGSPGPDNFYLFFDHPMLHSQLESFVEFVLAKLREQWKSLLQGIFPFHHLQTMLLVCFVQLISVNRLIQALPVLVAYIGFGAMAFATLSMFHSKNMIRDIEVWERLLKIFSQKNQDERKERESESEGGTPGPSQSDSQTTTSQTESTESGSKEQSFYKSQSYEPYIFFFAATTVFVVSFGLCGKQVPNCFLLCGVSIFFCLFCFVALTDRLDIISLCALSLNFLSHLPLIQKKLGFRIFPLFRHLVHFQLGYIKLSLGLTSLAFLAVPLIYASMALTSPPKAIIRTLVPHLVCYVWSDVSLTLFLSAYLKFELTNLLLTGGIISLMVSPTGAGLALVGGLVLAQLRNSLTFLSVLKALTTLLILFLPFFYRKFLTASSKYWPDMGFPKGNNRTRTLILVGMYVWLVLLAVTFLYHGKVIGVQSQTANLTWATFEKRCGAHTKANDNQVLDQMACSELKGMSVEWKGSVQMIRVSKIDNSLENLFDYLPNGISEWLRCFYGTKDPEIEKTWDFTTESCSLAGQHRYTFEIEAVGPWGQQMISSNKGTVILTASDVFTPLVSQLAEGDAVGFVGLFEQYPIFRYPPKLRLLRLSCITCRFQSKRRDVPKSELTVSDFSVYSGFWSRLFYGFKYLFNFIFAPLFYIPT